MDEMKMMTEKEVRKYGVMAIASSVAFFLGLCGFWCSTDPEWMRVCVTISLLGLSLEITAYIRIFAGALGLLTRVVKGEKEDGNPANREGDEDGE